MAGEALGGRPAYGTYAGTCTHASRKAKYQSIAKDGFKSIGCQSQSAAKQATAVSGARNLEVCMQLVMAKQVIIC